jgi:hypothetical protein
MSILVVDAFVRMRELVASHKDIAARVEKLERSHDPTGSVIEVLAEDIESPLPQSRTDQSSIAIWQKGELDTAASGRISSRLRLETPTPVNSAMV